MPKGTTLERGMPGAAGFLRSRGKCPPGQRGHFPSPPMGEGQGEGERGQGTGQS